MPAPPPSTSAWQRETTGSDSAEFRLRAARAWLAAGRAADADRVLALLPAAAHAATGARAEPAAHPVRGGCRAAAMRPGAKSAPCRRPTAPGCRRALLRNPPAGGHRHRPPARWHPLGARARATHRHRAMRTRALGVVGAAACCGGARCLARRRHPAATPPCAAGSRPPRWRADNARNPTLGATRLAAFRARYPVASGARRARRASPASASRNRRPALEAAPHLALMLPLSGRTAAAGGADPRRLHDGLLPAAGRHARRGCASTTRAIDVRSPTPWRRPRRPAPSSSSAR